MVEELAYRIKTEVYEGPFDLLLKAIDDGQVDIYKISLAQVVDSYFAYWQAESPNLITAADFLYLAAFLIELKSRQLLPYREPRLEEENLLQVEEALVNHIQEYEIYKKIAARLRERKEIFERIYNRPDGEVIEGQIELVDVSLRDLVMAFQKIYREAAEREKIVPIAAEELTLEDRIIEIKRLLAGRKDGIPFEDLFLRRSRLEIVVTFLAMLELAKQRFLMITQSRRFGSILVFPEGVIDGNSPS